jgi:hypothetical protein
VDEGFAGLLARKRTALERTNFNCIQKHIPSLLVFGGRKVDTSAPSYISIARISLRQSNLMAILPALAAHRTQGYRQMLSYLG